MIPLLTLHGLDPGPVAVVLLVAAATNLVSYYLAGRLARDRTVEAPARPRREARIDPEAGTVACPNCETENELGYRFCRECLGDLPGAHDRSQSGTAPLGRGLR